MEIFDILQVRLIFERKARIWQYTTPYVGRRLFTTKYPTDLEKNLPRTNTLAMSVTEKKVIKR
jgi:hypothetical protein